MANCKEHGPAYTGRPTAYVRTRTAAVVVFVVVIYLPVCRDTVSPADPESLQTVNLVLCMVFSFFWFFAAMSRPVSRGSGSGPISRGLDERRERAGSE